jgi:hypothetical protein
MTIGQLKLENAVLTQRLNPWLLIHDIR